MKNLLTGYMAEHFYVFKEQKIPKHLHVPNYVPYKTLK